LLAVAGMLASIAGAIAAGEAVAVKRGAFV
jgi:hypothetical protein